MGDLFHASSLAHSLPNGSSRIPGPRLFDRDLTATTIPPVNAGWVSAAFTPEEARTPGQKELLAVSDKLISELEQADEYVIGVPMHHFGFPRC